MLDLNSWTELDRHRLILFMPVAMAFGAAAYFALLTEPKIWPYALALFAALVASWLLRKKWLLVYVAMYVAAGLFGFINAALHTQLSGHRVLGEPVFWKEVSGKVEEVQLDEGQQKVVLSGVNIETVPPEKTPHMLRITFKKAQETKIEAGDELSVRATLFPLPDPIAPGGFDYARFLYFKSFGAVGYTTDQALITKQPPGMWHHINRFRVEFASQLLKRLNAPEGSIAAAITVGEQQAVPEEVNELLRQAGIYHILSISGVHMSIAAGLIFLVVRALLACSTYITLHYSTKKLAAALALISCFAYLLVAGAPTPAVRSFIMVAMVFIAMMLDRKGISFYALCWAAFFIILFQPHAVVTASFQLSFAATAAIVALYERFGGLLYQPSQHWLKRIWVAVLATLLVSLVATLATAPFIMTHFQRLQPWGLVANSLVSPITTFMIMPGAVLSFLGWPLSLEGAGFWLMEVGIHWMVAIGAITTKLPYADLYVPPLSEFGFVIAVAGFCLFLILQTCLRYAGLVLLMIGGTTMLSYDAPTIFIGERAKQIAVTDAAGQLVMLKGSPKSFLGDGWARLHGSDVAVSRKQAIWSDEIKGGCKRAGCFYQYGGHRFVFVARPQETNKMCEQYSANILVFNYQLYDGECTNLTKVIDREYLTMAGSVDMTLTKYNNYSSSSDEDSLAAQRSSTAFGSATDTDSQANRYNIIIREMSPLRGNRPWTQ